MGQSESKKSLRELEEEATLELHSELARVRELTAENPPEPSPAVAEKIASSVDPEWEYVTKTLPTDEEGYVVAFSPDDGEGIREFFAEYGVVVVANAISAEEAEAGLDGLWNFLARRSDKPGLEDFPTPERNKPETWGPGSWPGLEKLGILGDTILLEPAAFDIRVADGVLASFSHLLGTDEIWVNVGRASAMRPTVGVRLPVSALDAERKGDAELLENAERVVDELGRECVVIEDMSSRRTVEGWLHLDYNPVTGEGTSFSWKVADPGANVFDPDDKNVKLQGVVALKDCSKNDGGFHCVPGIAPHIHDWIALYGDYPPRPSAGDTTLQIPKNDPMRQDIQRVPIRAGSLLIWDSATPHGTFPNTSGEFRAIQYVKATRRDQKYWRPLFDASFLPEGWEVPPGKEAYLGL